MGSKSIIAGLTLFLLAPLPAMLAQSSGSGGTGGGGAVNVPGGEVGPPPKTPTDAASNPAESADQVVVSDVPFEQVIMPNQRPTDSVYGVDTNVQDTPRDVTIISREQLSAVDIQDPRDFSKLTSDSFTQSNFGAPANPSLRGQTADVFKNGIRLGLTSNGNGFPIDFNSVESVDIVKGPANAVFGASQYTGGYIDEITKQPFFDKFQGNVGTTIGMYQVYRWSADFGGPLIKNELAFRISYTGEDSGSYYDYSHKQSEAIYGAVTWTPKNTNYTLAFNAEFDEADYNENNGINRVTQNLIDNDKYITGTVPGGNAAINPFFNPVVAGPDYHPRPRAAHHRFRRRFLRPHGRPPKPSRPSTSTMASRSSTTRSTSASTAVPTTHNSSTNLSRTTPRWTTGWSLSGTLTSRFISGMSQQGRHVQGHQGGRQECRRVVEEGRRQGSDLP